MSSCLSFYENVVMNQSHCKQEHLIIPANIDNEKVVEIVGIGTQSNKFVKKIIIEEGIEKIGFCAFLNFYELEEIVLPKSIKFIDEKAFENCLKLKEIIIPENVKTIEAETFSKCISLEKVVFPEGVKRIGCCAFSQCSSLQEIVLPQSLKEIGNHAFSYCKNLKELIIPKNVSNVGDYIVSDGEIAVKVENAKNAVRWNKKWCFWVKNIDYFNTEDVGISLMSSGDKGLALLYGQKYNIKDKCLYQGDDQDPYKVFVERFNQFKRDFKDF